MFSDNIPLVRTSTSASQYGDVPRISMTAPTQIDPSSSMDTLPPPSAPFASPSGLRPPSLQSFTFSNTPSTSSGHVQSKTSLSLNYIPAKFSQPHEPGIHHRKSAVPTLRHAQPRGGGRAAFAEGESRMPEDGDEDYDGWVGEKEVGKTKPRLRWNRFKWILFVSNLSITVYTLTALIFLLLTWFNTFPQADVVRTANRTELIISTVAASLGLLTSLIGWSGILLNNRAFLSIYCLLLWICFVFLVAPGYMTYKRKTFNLEGKINSQWSRGLGVEGRLKVQNQLDCCGYYSPFVEATISQTCYARSMLPGCKAGFLHFERNTLQRWYTIAFALVPLHLVAIVVSLLCSNHVTYRFGKGMMPSAYRLNRNTMAMVMDSYSAQLADQYNIPSGDPRFPHPRAGSHGIDSLYYDNYADTIDTANSVDGNGREFPYDGEDVKRS